MREKDATTGRWKTLDIVANFWSKAEVGGPEECWPWRAGRCKDGYGKFAVWKPGEQKQKHWRAHRFAYGLAHGGVQPDEVMHTCDNPPCVNPGHLRAGTRAENYHDSVDKGRTARLAGRWCSLDSLPANELITGDCREIMAQLPDRSIDVLIADPPYSEHTHKCGRRGATSYREGKRGTRRAEISRNRDLGFAHLQPELRRACAEEFARITKRWILVFTDHEGGQAWADDLRGAGAEVVRFGVWVKKGATPQFTGDRPAQGHEVIIIAHAPREKGTRLRWNGGGRHAVWTVPIVLNRGGNDERIHTTQKPMDLMLALVRDFTNPGERILDPFAGGATTLCAAKTLGRVGIGVEINPAWAAAGRARLEKTLEQPDLFKAPPPPSVQGGLGLESKPTVGGA